MEHASEIPKGTAIATFVHGQYPSDERHAAIFLDADATGIDVIEQFQGQVSQRRHIHFGSHGRQTTRTRTTSSSSTRAWSASAETPTTDTTPLPAAWGSPGALVRFMAAGPLLAGAIAELGALEEGAHERTVADQISVNLEHVLGSKLGKTPEEEEFVMSMQGTWKDARRIGATEAQRARCAHRTARPPYHRAGRRVRAHPGREGSGAPRALARARQRRHIGRRSARRRESRGLTWPGGMPAATPLAVCLTLVGLAVADLPYSVVALRRLDDDGLGPCRTRFHIDAVRVLDAAGLAGEAVFSRGSDLVRPLRLPHRALPPLPRAPLTGGQGRRPAWRPIVPRRAGAVTGARPLRSGEAGLGTCARADAEQADFDYDAACRRCVPPATSREPERRASRRRHRRPGLRRSRRMTALTIAKSHDRLSVATSSLTNQFLHPVGRVDSNRIISFTSKRFLDASAHIIVEPNNFFDVLGVARDRGLGEHIPGNEQDRNAFTMHPLATRSQIGTVENPARIGLQILPNDLCNHVRDTVGTEPIQKKWQARQELSLR